MSASAVNVGSDKQTLILAGEPIPPPRSATRGGARSERGVQLQRVTILLVQGEYAAGTLAADSGGSPLPAAPESRRALLPSPAAIAAPTEFPMPWSNRVLSGGAAEYARTQHLSGGGTRSQFIDTYA